MPRPNVAAHPKRYGLRFDDRAQMRIQTADDPRWVSFLPPNDASRACALMIGIAAFLLPRFCFSFLSSLHHRSGGPSASCGSGGGCLVPPATSPLRLAVEAALMLVRLAVEAAVRLAMEAATRLVRLAMEAATRLVRLAMEAATRPRVTRPRVTRLAMRRQRGW